MLFEISEYYTGGKIRLKPRVELYDTRDYMGKQMPGLAIVLDEVDQKENVTEQYAVLTVSFGDFLALKNCAFIDTNNCPFAAAPFRRNRAGYWPQQNQRLLRISPVGVQGGLSEGNRRRKVRAVF